MSRRTLRRRFTTLSAAVSLLYGVAGLIATEPLARFGGFVNSVPSAGFGQFLAASYVGYGVMNWFARDIRDSAARQAIALGNFTGWLLSFVLAVLDVSSGTLRTFGWPTVLLTAVFSAGWGYFALARPVWDARSRARPAGTLP